VLGCKTVHRMILGELLKVFLLALVGLTSLLLLAGLVSEAAQHGMTPAQIMTVIPLLVPNMLPYTLPTTTLFATCIVYGRLAADNEILAIKAAGVHIGQVVWPAVLLGLGTSAVTGVLYYEIIPTTHHTLRTHVFNDIEGYLYGILRKDGEIRHPKLNYTIAVARVEGDILRDAIFGRIDPKTKLYDVIAIADEAKLRVDRENHLLRIDMRNCRIVDQNNLDNVRVEENKSWPVELPEEFDAPPKMRPTDMTWDELDTIRAELVAKVQELRGEIAAEEAKINHSGRPPSQSAKDLIHGWRYQEQQVLATIQAIDVDKQMRPAVALGCLCFVLVGAPVGIWFSKSDYLSAFITCFLPIIVVYYPLLLSSINAAKGLKLTPLVVWSANGVVLVIALVLFRRLARN
jgi:lipopolysaccharide export system permease protein